MRGAVEFVVRERFAEQAPGLCSSRTGARAWRSIGTRGWPSRCAAVVEGPVAESTFRARGPVGSLHFAGDDAVWTRPTGNPRLARSVARDEVHRRPGTLAEGIERLGFARALPPGSFLFVVSDFLDPVPEAVHRAHRGWDLVPVVVQDLT